MKTQILDSHNLKWRQYNKKNIEKPKIVVRPVKFKINTQIINSFKLKKNQCQYNTKINKQKKHKRKHLDNGSTSDEI